jgi:hypothetical protein
MVTIRAQLFSYQQDGMVTTPNGVFTNAKEALQTWHVQSLFNAGDFGL